MIDDSIYRSLLELLAIVLLLGLNGIFALSEIAIVSAKKARLSQLMVTDLRAKAALALAEEPTGFLATVQIGITLVGILAGALSGATLSTELAGWLGSWPWLASSADLIAFLLVVVLVTYLSLMIGELIPKSIALSDPERFAMRVARPMQILARLASPLVTLLTRSTDLTLRWLRVQPDIQPPVTEDELKLLLLAGTDAGVFEQIEQQLVTQALTLDDVTLRSVITHRTKVKWLDVRDSAENAWQTIVTHPHTHFPVCEGTVDQVVGLVSARDVLLAINETSKGQKVFDLKELAQEPIFVPLSASPSTILHHLHQRKVPMFFALDEYGGTEGIVTMGDILEMLVGTPELLNEG